MKLPQLFIALMMVVSITSSSFAQDPPAAKATIKIHRGLKTERIIEVMGAMDLGRISALKFEKTDQPDVSIEIHSTLAKAEYADLIRSLADIGVDEVQVLPIPIQYETYTAEKLQAARAGKGAIVFMRADWCLACQAIESKTFADPDLLRLINESGVPILKADITDGNKKTEAGRLVAKVGITNVPTFIVYPSDLTKDPLVLESETSIDQISGMIREHLERESQ